MTVLVVGSDRAGFQLKQDVIELLKQRGFEVEDLGCDQGECGEYPDYARKVAKVVANNDNRLGLLVCGTGIGMSIAANKYKNVRAALCHSEYESQISRGKFNANVICIGSRSIRADAAARVVTRFIRSEFKSNLNEQYLERIEEMAYS